MWWRPSYAAAMFYILGLIAAVAVCGVAVGCCCGTWCAQAVLKKAASTDELVKEPTTKPAASTRKRTPLATKAADDEGPSDHHDDQLGLASLLVGFTLETLKDSCRALKLPVGGLKADVVRRLSSFPGAPKVNQIEEVKKLQLVLLARGLDCSLAASDLRSCECTRVWLSRAQAELATR